MAKLYIPASEEQFVDTLKEKGLGLSRKASHWIVARLALARSLQMPQIPDEDIARPLTAERGKDIHMTQMTGENNPGMEDLTDEFRVLLSIYHDRDLFADPELFVDLLQRHLQRGLAEIRSSWREGNNFYDYLYQELFFERSTGTAEAPADLGIRVQRALGEIGVGADIEEMVDGPRLTRFILHLAGSADLDRLHKDVDKVPFELGIKRNVTVSQVSGERRVALDVPRAEREWHPVEGSKIPTWVRDRAEALPVCPGTDVLGEPVVFDLAEAPHLFVAGMTGAGKSVCVHSLLLSLLASGKAVRLALIDPKEVEFSAYASCRRLWGDGVISEAGEAAEMLADLVNEMDVRQKELSCLGAANLQEAQERGSDLPRIVVVVDELADLLMQRPDSQGSLVRLAQKARAVGIHLVLATQRPGADTFPGLLRANIAARIALTVRSGQDSRVIIDETGAEKLLMKGDMLIRLPGQQTTRAHGARVEQGDIRAWL